jgi:hypothetical protein
MVPFLPRFHDQPEGLYIDVYYDGDSTGYHYFDPSVSALGPGGASFDMFNYVVGVPPTTGPSYNMSISDFVVCPFH